LGLLDEIAGMTSEQLAQAHIVVGVDSGPLKKGLASIGAETQAATGKWGAAFKLVGIGIAALATSMVGFAIEGIKAADELDATVGRIGAQVGYTAKQTAQLRAGLLDMSTRTQQSVQDLAKSIENVAKSGYSVADSLLIQESSARAATVTHSDLATVTNTVVTAMKAWNIAGKDVNTVTDTLLTTVGQSRIDWDALSRIIATAAPIAKDAGVSFGDLNAAIIAIGRSGIPARRAASGVITLIRSLTGATAQKEMALLGITVNQTTIAHDGLLATLQKVDAAAGKHVSVIVRTKGVHVDLTKATETLRVAQLRLSEVEAKGTASGSSLLAAKNRVADASRRLATLQAKESAGGIDLAKSQTATEKANRGNLAALQAMLGGASGVVTSDILLANGAKDYKAGQDALNKSLGTTNEEFQKVKEADLSVQLALIRNQVTRFAIDIGTVLLPYVGQLLAWLTVEIPQALKGIGSLWDNVLKAPVTAMVNSFLGMASALNDVLFNFGSGTTGATGGMTSFFTGLLGIVVDITKDIGGVFDVVKNLLNLPFAGAAVKLLAVLGIVKSLTSLLPELGRLLTGKALGALNFATGGIFKLGSTASSADLTGATATKEAAKLTADAAIKLDEASTKVGESSAEAGTKLGEAAGKLGVAAETMTESSRIQAEAGVVTAETPVNAAELIRNQTYTESTIAANEATINAAKANEGAAKQTVVADDSTLKTNETIDTTMATTDAAMASVDTGAKAMTDSAAAMKVSTTETAAAVKTAAAEQTNIVARGVASTVAATEAGEAERVAIARAGAIGGVAGATEGGLLSGMRSKAGSLLGAAGGVLGGLISKAVVPLLVAQLATEILKAPLGELISSQLGLTRVGELMKNDFLGGMLALFQTALVTGGSDAWVGRAATMTIGSVKFNTMSLAKIGVTNATFDQLQSPVGTIDHAHGIAVAASDISSSDIKPKVGEDVAAWYARIRDHLGADIQTAADAVIKSGTIWSGSFKGGSINGGLTDAAKAALQKAVSDGLSAQGSALSAATMEDYIQALTPTLMGRGWTKADIGRLDLSQLKALGSLAADDTSGKLAFLQDFVMQEALRGSVVPKTTGQAVLSADIEKRVASFVAAFGTDWQKVVGSAVQANTKKSKVDEVTRKALAKMLGVQDWEAITRDTLRVVRPRPKSPVPGGFKEEVAKIAFDEQAATQAMRDYYVNWTAAQRDELDPFLGNLKNLSSTTTDALNKQFKTTGDNWITAFRDGSKNIADIKDPKVRATLTALGPNFAGMLAGFGEMLWEKNGGAAATALKNELATAISGEISKLTTADFTLTDKNGRPRTATGKPLTLSQERANVSTALATPAAQAALTAATSTDTNTAKKGFQDLGDALKKSIPDEGTRNRFIGTLLLIQKTGTALPVLNSALVAPGKNVDDLTSSVTGLSTASSLAASSVDALTRWIRSTFGPGGLTGAGPHGGSVTANLPPQRVSGKNSARGDIWDANAISHGTVGGVNATIGEAGNEEVAVVSHPKSISWAELAGLNPSTARLPGGTSRGGTSGGGSHQSIQVDHMHIQSAADEQAILDTLEFMAPGGIAS
jgi:TP901 family phage tail tape measure protein